MSQHSRRALILLSGITLALSACAAGPELDVTIHESERGAVYVERFADRSFHASHPMRVSAEMMTRILRGVVVKDTGGILGSLLVSKPQTMQAFGNEDVEYLAPLLADGLARAASDQQVGFRIVQVSEPVSPQSGGLAFCASSVRFPGACSSEQPLVTEGSLYVSGRSLHLTLTEFRHRLEPGETYSKTTPRMSNPKGLTNRTVLFVPESAARSTDATLVIDYDLLATMPAASDMRPTAAQPPTPATGEPTQRNTDVDELRKELQDIKKKLAEQDAERSRLKP
ncbi:MAG: hypothetical protein HY038_09310 [Nitrospirae bacterium]|nr:hypothetical protein [Nitrospirota bacterium]